MTRTIPERLTRRMAGRLMGGLSGRSARLDRVLALVALLGWAGCSSSAPQDVTTGESTGGHRSIGSETGGAANPVSGTGGAPASPPASDGTGGAGPVDPIPGTGSGGSHGSLGSDAGIGSDKDAGRSATGGSVGTTVPVTGGEMVRGPAPTMASASTKGPYTVKTYTSGFADEPGFGAATVYYPTDADPPFAAVAICPGFTATQSSIATWGPFLASHGMVVMTIDTNTTGDSVVQRSTALTDALESLKGENTRSGSPLMGRVDVTRLGLMGWSMGGGATWIDANKHPELRTAITLAGHIASAPGGGADIKSISVPTLMFAGQTDSAILGGAMSQPIYTQIPESTPKMLYEVAGLGHDAGNNPANNNKNVGLYGLSWQKVFLEGDVRYRQFLLTKGPNASDFRTNLK